MAKKKKKGADTRGYSSGSTAPSRIPPKTTNTQKRTASKSSSSPAPVKVQVSSQTHEGLTNLLGQLQVSDAATLTTTAASAAGGIRSDRFVKRLTNVADRLLQVGFEMTALEDVCRALGYDITLELALDWLCLHYPAEQLPSIFTGQVKTDPASSPAGSTDPLTIILASTTGGQAEDPLNNNVGGEQKSHQTLQARSFKEPELTSKEPDNPEKPTSTLSAEEKARLLQQYAYIEEEEDNIEAADTYTNVVVENETEATTEATQDADMEATSEAAQDADIKGFDPDMIIVEDEMEAANTQDPSVTTMDQKETQVDALAVHPDVLRLQELEAELEQAERDVNDEGANYMRSKAENKELQKHVKQLRKKVQGQQRKVDRLRAEVAAAADDGDDESADDEAEGGAFGGDLFGGGLFSMSDPKDNTIDTVSVSVTDSVPSVDEKSKAPPLVLPEDAIPRTWTGKTPKVILAEFCRKHKCPRPIYNQLPQNGCRIIVKRPSKEVLTLVQEGPLFSNALAQEYMATRALYDMNKGLPLYRLFPPFFRDLWKSWEDKEQQEKSAVVEEGHLVRQATVESLLDIIEQESATRSGDQPTVSNVDEIEEDEPEDVVLVSWEDTTDDFSPEGTEPEGTNKKQTKAGAHLRDQFESHRQSPKYQSMLKERVSLPMYSFRDRILETIRNEQVTILCAETGAGKTTQCPQFILEDALLQGNGDRVSILCTQPRRVAATSVAERVSEEMGEKTLGGTVGYQIRLEAKKSQKTKLLFCTTGIVLRRLQEDPELKGVTHVVVDEVHERQFQIDVLLIALRRLLNTTRKDLKVVLMSATLDADLFCSFFNGAPLVSVPGRTFPVSNYYLEDLMDATNHIIEEGSPFALRNFTRSAMASLMVTGRGGEKRKQTHSLDSQVDINNVSDDFVGYKMTTRRSMDRVNEERINYDLIEDVLRLLLINSSQNDSLVAPEGADLSHGSILVFLPGIGEIRTLSDRLEASRDLGKRDRFEVIPLHSTLSSKDQRRAFAKPKRGCRKIILATNIAETSVTIPDVVCVIDSGRMREVRQNKRTSTSMLVTDWCPRSSAKQRAGRAGRVQPGICLKLFSSRTQKLVMREMSEPELRRVPLEEVCLGILAGGFADNCMDFLQQAPQPPTQEAVQAALRVLNDVGAVHLDSSSRERLTPLGHHLAKLPVHVRLGKMLVFGSLFRCIDPILTVAASLSCQSPFSSYWGEANQAKAKHKSFADNESDFMTICNVWKAYCRAASKGSQKARSFSKEYYLSKSALDEIRDTREHFLDLLSGLGFLDRSKLQRNRQWYDSELSSGHTFDENSNNLDAVHAIICGGLYPNVAHLRGSTSLDRTLWHDKERLYFHSSSVNAKLTSSPGPPAWVVFFEKFETARVYAATTSPIHPLAILLFGGSIVVQHLERKVLVDEWMEFGIPAQTGVMFREVRRKVDHVLEAMISNVTTKSATAEADLVVDGIVKLLTSTSGREYSN